jgi:predicted nucleic acid-binding protein
VSVVPGPAPFVAMTDGHAPASTPTMADEARATTVPRPRRSPEREPTPPQGTATVPATEPAAVGSADGVRVYADGSALSRYLAGAPCQDDWLAWVVRHEAELVTSPLALTELRTIAGPRGLDARTAASEIADRLEVVRFSDQALRHATKVSGVMSAFRALHVGAAVAHPEVHAVATYDIRLAQVCVLFGLGVVSPGWPDRWWEQG